MHQRDSHFENFSHAQIARGLGTNTTSFPSFFLHFLETLDFSLMLFSVRSLFLY